MTTPAKSTRATTARKPAAKKPADRKPAASAPLEVKAKRRNKITVKLVGQTYQATPPKAIISMKFARVAQEAGEDVTAMVDALMEWLELTFQDGQADKIEARLYDPNDDIDFPHVIELMQKLTEKTTEGNPTT